MEEEQEILAARRKGQEEKEKEKERGAEGDKLPAAAAPDGTVTGE